MNKIKMNKIIFLNLPAHGHINPTLALINELTDRWHEVIYYSFPEFKEKIIATWAIYKEYTHAKNLVDNKKLLESMPFMYYKIMEASYLIIDDLISDMKELKPDLIIHDAVSFWGKSLNKITKIPTISSFACWLLTLKWIGIKKTIKETLKTKTKDIKHFLQAQKYYKKICKKYNLHKEFFLHNIMNTADLNIVYTSREFQADQKSLPDKHYKFVGPSISVRNETFDKINLKDTKKPIIYIALWTIINDNISFYNNCINALKTINATVIMAVGKNTNIKIFKKLPSNFIIKNYVNQLEILRHTDIFITHWGMNSVQEWLLNAVPLIVRPYIIEQDVIASQIKKTWCGIILKKNSIETIKKAIEKVIENKQYRANCKKMAKSLKKAWWYLKAADHVEKYLNKIDF